MTWDSWIPWRSQNQISKFTTCKHRVDLIRDRGRWVFQLWSSSGAQGRKLWQTKNKGWRQQCQTQGTSFRPWFNRLTSYPTLEKHRCLAEPTGYYSNQYSISNYGILWFLCAYYDVTPPNIQRKYYGCVISFDVNHWISCSNGGFVIAHHNKVRGKLLYISQWAFPSAWVNVKPLMCQGRIRLEVDIRQGSDRLDRRGTLSIRLI